MRKLISFLMIIVLLVSVFTFSAQAVLRQKKASVSYGTPTVDGVMDDCYNNSDPLVIEYVASIANNAEEGMEYATGKAWLCWDENALYIYLDMVDKTPVTQPLDNPSSDAFELVIDFDNVMDDGAYGDNGLFVKTLAYAKTVGSPEMEIDWVENFGSDHQYWFIDQPESEHQIACVIKPDGYIIERRIPLWGAVKAMLKPGFAFGFQIWILDDIDDNNQRDFKLVWGEPTDDVGVGSWNDPAVCDELILTAAPTPPPAADPDPIPDPIPDDPGGSDAAVQPPAVTPPAPQTGDASILFGLISLIGAGGITFFRKRK